MLESIFSNHTKMVQTKLFWNLEIIRMEIDFYAQSMIVGGTIFFPVCEFMLNQVKVKNTMIFWNICQTRVWPILLLQIKIILCRNQISDSSERFLISMNHIIINNICEKFVSELLLLKFLSSVFLILSSLNIARVWYTDKDRVTYLSDEND